MKRTEIPIGKYTMAHSNFDYLSKSVTDFRDLKSLVVFFLLHFEKVWRGRKSPVPTSMELNNWLRIGDIVKIVR